MKDLLLTLPIQFTIAIAVVASAGAQDRALQVPNAVQVPTAQQEWWFDANQADWRLLLEPDPSFTPAVVSRTADALRVTLVDGKFLASGTAGGPIYGGGIYVDVPPSSVPFRVVVQARTNDAIRMLVGINPSTTDGFQTSDGGAVTVSDGALHTYEVFVFSPIRNPVRRVGLWFGARAPGRVDILSIRFIRQATTDRWEYRGFAVDVGAPDASWNRDAFLQALRRQFDIVASAGLDQRALDFFRSVPIVIDPVAPADQTLDQTLPQPGRYLAGSTLEAGTVIVVPRVYNPDNPVFLHEFLHAYHAKKLLGGWGNSGNPDILHLFKEARDSQAFPADSYMMSHVNEYFAMAGSVYLHGSAARDPFTRENLKNRQPALYQWFAQEFGPR